MNTINYQHPMQARQRCPQHPEQFHFEDDCPVKMLQGKPECLCIERREGTVRYADQSICPRHKLEP